MNDSNEQDAWLARPSSIALLWKVFWGILILTVLLQFVVYVKGYFGIDGWIGFGAVFGFVSCLLMVIAAKGLGMVLKREENYYLKELEDD